MFIDNIYRDDGFTTLARYGEFATIGGDLRKKATTMEYILYVILLFPGDVAGNATIDSHAFQSKSACESAAGEIRKTLVKQSEYFGGTNKVNFNFQYLCVPSSDESE